MEIDGTTALVTGAGSGLGKATAELLTARGARVVAFDRDSAQLDDLVARLGVTRLIAVSGDVTSEADVTRALHEAGGSLASVVHCAGIGPSARILSRSGTHELELFDRVIRVNLSGSFNVLRLAAAEMAKRQVREGEDCGVVILTSSIAAFEGQIGQVAYSASKGGVVAMTLAAARDLARHRIRVNAIAPGIFDTALLGTVSDDVRAQLAQSVPYPARLGQAGEYAALAVHIVENQMLNGAVIRLDAALRMSP